MKKALLGMAAVLSAALVGCGSISNNVAGSERFFPEVPDGYDLAREQAPEGWNNTNQPNVYWRWCKSVKQCPKVWGSMKDVPLNRAHLNHFTSEPFDPDSMVAIEVWSPDVNVENLYLTMKFYDKDGNFINDYNNFIGGTVSEPAADIVQRGTSRAFVPFSFPYDGFHTAELSKLEVRTTSSYL